MLRITTKATGILAAARCAIRFALPVPFSCGLVAALAVSVVGCGGSIATDRGPAGPVTLDLEPTAVLVSEESALIAEAADIEVDDGGNVLVVDYRAPRILIVPPDGGEPTAVGRGGEGPGEFRFPFAVGGAAGVVYVFDMSRGNVQRFDYEGTYLGESAFPLNASGIELSADGRIAFNKFPSTSGKLITVADFEGNELLHVGDLVVAEVDAWLSWHLPLGHPGVITVHGPDGHMRHRLQFPSIRTTSRFAVDAERGRLYLYVNDESSVVMIDLPEGIVS